MSGNPPNPPPSRDGSRMNAALQYARNNEQPTTHESHLNYFQSLNALRQAVTHTNISIPDPPPLYSQMTYVERQAILQARQQPLLNILAENWSTTGRFNYVRNAANAEMQNLRNRNRARVRS